MKNFFNYLIFLILFLSFIFILGFGSLVKYHYDGGKKYQFLQKSVIFIANVPMNIRKMIKLRSFDLDKPPILFKYKDKKRFVQFIKNKRNAILVLPRYDHSLSRSVVDIIDLNNFKIIHTYKHDSDEMYNQVKNIKEFSRLKIDYSPIRFRYRHPILLDDGSLISMHGPIFNIDLCSNLQWINDEETFHHSLMLDHEGNIWAGGRMSPKSKYVKKYSIEKFIDDSVIKINIDGKILFNKSVTEILIENNILSNNFAFITSRMGIFDPIHLNDIEPAFVDTEYWKQGDIFISVRAQSAIIHYRPSNNKVINYITGPFADQHDVDIISDKEISIFNNNNFFDNNKHSEVLIYNFETKKFTKLFNNQLQKENFKATWQGLSHIFKDRSLLVEDHNEGIIILFNSMGEKEFEFVNKDRNGDIGPLFWSRVIEDDLFIEKFKSSIKNKKCIN